MSSRKDMLEPKPAPEDVTLFRNRMVADAIAEMWSTGAGGLIPSTINVPLRCSQETDRGRTPCAGEGREKAMQP